MKSIVGLHVAFLEGIGGGEEASNPVVTCSLWSCFELQVDVDLMF